MKNEHHVVSILKNSQGHFVHICHQTGRWICNNELSCEEIAYLQDGFAPLSLARYTPTPNQIILNVTNRCNLNCVYCYAKNKGEEEISENVFVETIKFLGKISGGRDSSILLTGGEPMLVWDKIFTWIEKYRKAIPVNVTFALQSNGTLINKNNAAQLRKERVNVGISLDGSQEFHNMCRTQSYELALQSIKILQKNKIQAGARITVTADSSSTTPDAIRYYVSQDIKHFTVGFVDPLGAAALRQEFLPTAKQRLRLCNEMLQICVDEFRKGNRIEILSVSQMIINLLTNLRPSCCPNSPCGAGVSLLGVDTNGDVYPCDYLFEPSMKLGNITQFSKVLKNLDTCTSLQNLQNAHLGECEQCPVFSICTGGCRIARLAYDRMNGSFPNCGYMTTLVADYAWKITNDEDTRKYAASIATGDLKTPGFGLQQIKGTLSDGAHP